MLREFWPKARKQQEDNKT